MGFIMLAMFVAYIAANIHQMKNAPAEEHEEEEETMPLPRMLMLLVLGAVLIAMGANLLVDNGTLIAQALGVPESVIALTFVALGTSLPELVTAITSLIKDVYKRQVQGPCRCAQPWAMTSSRSSSSAVARPR